MFSISVSAMAEATGASVELGDGSIVASTVQTDSRKVGEGDTFVCFPGERVNGNRFASAAIDAGASAVVMTEEPTGEVLSAAKTRGCAVLRAADDDATEFMLRIAAWWRERNPQWVVVGVTGSVGKTTTKDMLAAALATRYRVHATAGNFNNLIGLPLTVLSASEDDQVLVAEMGMNHKGELTRLSAVARPTVALVTNVGTSHIGLLGSRENIARAKAEILSCMGPSDRPQNGVSPCLEMTADNDFASLIEGEYAKPRGVDVTYVGTTEGCSPRALDIELDAESLPSLTLAFADGWEERVTLPIPGRHVVWDFLLAMGIADRLGVDRHQAAEAIAAMPQTHMRMEVVTAPGKPRLIDDSYNASPSSMAAALDVLCSMACEGRRVAVLGEIGELGGEGPRLHGYVGAYAAAKSLDLLVLVGGEGASEMREAALTMGFSEDRLELLPNVGEALSVIAPILRPTDLVLVKASRSVNLDQFVKGVLE